MKQAAPLSALFTLFLLVFAGSALAERRVALVIGNGAYQNTSTLANPVHDATDMAARLRDLGFTVITGLDLTEADFAYSVAEFAEKAERADVALFYYAGHGLQFEESNFLVPVDAKIKNQFQVRQQTVTLDSVVRLMESRAQKVLVFLDACRDNPLAERLKSKTRSVGRGLARVRTRAPETLITFAAAPGTVAADGTGRNSPFTASLLKHMTTPGVEIEVMLKRVTADVLQETGRKQRPERLSRLTTEFYFTPANVAGGDGNSGVKSDKNQTGGAENSLALAAQVWCADMAKSQPLEYLSLGSTKNNLTTVVHGGAYDGVGGKDMVTRFSRVRFDPKRLAILPKDLRFAKISGRVDQICCENGGIPKGTRKPIVPIYGVAQNCDGRSRKVRIAQARLDLSQTAFRLAPDMKWKGRGFFPRKTPPAKWDITLDRRKAVAVPRTGFCSAIGPVGGIIRLQYAGAPGQ